jgi:hypothetical protein
MPSKNSARTLFETESGASWTFPTLSWPSIAF